MPHESVMSEKPSATLKHFIWIMLVEFNYCGKLPYLRQRMTKEYVAKCDIVDASDCVYVFVPHTWKIFKFCFSWRILRWNYDDYQKKSLFSRVEVKKIETSAKYETKRFTWLTFNGAN